MEAVVALIVLLGPSWSIGSSWKLGVGWTSDGPGSGYFPFYIGLILCISGAGILIRRCSARSANTEIFVDSEQLRRVLSVLMPAIVYVLAMQLVGMYVASAIYIALFMIVPGQVLAG